MAKVNDIRELVEQKLFDPYFSIMIGMQPYPFFEKIMDHYVFVDHIIFEALYDNYINNASTISVKKFTEKYNCHNEAFNRRLRRKYTAYRQYKDNQYLQLCNFYNLDPSNTQYDNLQYTKLIGIKENKEGHRLREYQEFQLLNIDTFPIFKYIREGNITDKKNITIDKFIGLLEGINSIYQTIADDKEMTPFRKCVQYYHLENSLHFEYFYRIVLLCRDSRFPPEEQKNIRENLRMLIRFFNGKEIFENRFILGRLVYIPFIQDRWGKESTNFLFIKIAQEIYMLTVIKNVIKKEVCERICIQEISSDDKDAFSENFIGKGQHIACEKDINKNDIQHFRQLWRKS